MRGLLLMAICCLPLTVQASPLENLQKVGTAELNWMFFSVYEATLYSQEQRYVPRGYPQALEIKYRRDINKDDLVKATGDQWKHLGLTNADKQRWLQQLSSIWPDVKDGDTITFLVEEDGRNTFYFNNTEIGGVDSARFSDSFLAIWLSERTSEPDLRKQLIGVR